MKKKPSILITTGDPKGIGPEVTQKALKDPRIKTLADFYIIKPTDKTGLDAIKKAACILKKKKADGVVTAPVNKSLVNRSGIPFKGHTEFFAEATHTKKFAMMFCCPILRVTIVTRHVALKKVSGILTEAKISNAIKLTEGALRYYFKIPKPRIGVAGLNPHCGEDGLAGIEEKEIIAPAIKKVRSVIPRIEGPIPADSVFHMALKGRFDAVIAMYHDQGLGPFKMLAFEDGVNVTLGLPFVRTSPDHGTAYSIAGKGIAESRSMKEAIKLAVKMCRRG
ncbi:4-hydroxythreonine-4-phosphate dehydrogenase PdxA [Candidatus Omnitrophota bacterium]